MALVGCSPELWLRTPAPPSTKIAYNSTDKVIEITQGIAVAFEVICYGECVDVHASTDSPNVAKAFSAHFASIDRGYGLGADRNTSALALVGLAPGRTTLRVYADKRTTDYVVNVVPVQAPAH
jgi:hypothetical protein